MNTLLEGECGVDSILDYNSFENEFREHNTILCSRKSLCAAMFFFTIALHLANMIYLAVFVYDKEKTTASWSKNIRIRYNVYRQCAKIICHFSHLRRHQSKAKNYVVINKGKVPKAARTLSRTFCHGNSELQQILKKIIEVLKCFSSVTIHLQSTKLKLFTLNMKSIENIIIFENSREKNEKFQHKQTQNIKWSKCCYPMY